MSGHTLTDEEFNQQAAAVWKATFWLSFITVVEVVVALAWIWVFYPDGGGPRAMLNFFFGSASLLKAYFIVAEFMHVKYESRALALTILGPLLFLIWFVVAFLWEGSNWLNNRELWQNILG